MPRERIHHGTFRIEVEHPGTQEYPGAIVTQEWHPGDPQPPGSVLYEEPSFDVTWNRDGGWVQLAFDAPRRWWDGFIKSYANSPEQTHFPAYTEVLSRREINDLIRTLRRARDAAYGSDE